MAPLLDAEAAKPAQNCPPHRSDRLRWPGTVQNWAVPRIGAVLRLVDAGCSHDVDVHQDAQLHGPGDARKTAEKLPLAAKAAQGPSESPRAEVQQGQTACDGGEQLEMHRDGHRTLRSCRQRCDPRRALLAGLGGIWGGQLHSVMQFIIWADEAAASLRKSDAAGPSLSVRSPSPPTLAAQSAAGELG